VNDIKNSEVCKVAQNIHLFGKIIICVLQIGEHLSSLYSVSGSLQEQSVQGNLFFKQTPQHGVTSTLLHISELSSSSSM
jgi:hypothetical protein